MELQQIFTYFLFNQNMPRSDNRSCKLGLRLALASKQKIELVDIERYSTTHEEYVNVFDITHLHEKDSPEITHMGNGNFISKLYDERIIYSLYSFTR